MKLEPKKETLEESFRKLKLEFPILNNYNLHRLLQVARFGAKWQQEQNKNLYSEEEVKPLIEMLQKCKEYFLLKTDNKSEERADAIGQLLEQFKKQ